MRDEVLRLAGPAYTFEEQPAAGNTAAVELCTLLLADQEVLDVVLCLHDIRAAQLWNLLPSTRAPLPPPVFSGAFLRRLSQRQRSASDDQMDLFFEALGRDTIVEGDPLLGMWDSMHHAVLLVLAALQSLPIRPHPQHPDPAATTHTSAKLQVPPGYHRCSACLLLSLRLALRLNQLCIVQLKGVDQHLARLHSTLPGLLLGLSTAVSVMQAAGHPAAQAHRLLLLRCILHLGPLQGRILLEDIRDHCQDVATYPTDKVTTSYPDYLAHLLASSPVVTGWPGSPPAKPSYEHSHSTAGASSGVGHTSGSSSSRGWGSSKVQGSSQGQSGKGSSTGSPMDLASVNTYAHVAQALCSVLGRQEEGLIITQLVSMCQAEGSVLPRCLIALQAGVASTRLCASIGTLTMPDAFPICLRASYTLLCDALQLMVELWPDWRCRPAMLRVLVRTVAAGAHGYSTMAMLLDGAPNYEAETRLLSGLKRTPEVKALTPELEAILSSTLECVCSGWVFLLLPLGESEQALGSQSAESNASRNKEEVHNLPPSAQQLAPLALDLVWGMEGMMQMMQQHWRMFPPMARVEDSSLFRICCASLDLFGHVINALAEPTAVGPAGLAAQPASWLPCGNSLVEGWCSQLLAWVCQLFCINSPDLEGPPDHIQIISCLALANSHKSLLQGQWQAPPSMSPEAERLLSCLTLVLTVALPLDTWLAAAPSLPAAGAEIIEQAIHDLLTRVEAEQVWSWQALAAGTPAEASLASVLQGAANKLQLPHLVAPAPHGWQPGRLTLEMGRGPPEFMTLCFPVPAAAAGYFCLMVKVDILQSACSSGLDKAPACVYVRRLEAACQLLHRKLQPSSVAAAQTDSSRPAAHNAPPAGAPPTPSAAGNTAAAELCTLLLTDQEVLDVVLALHDIRIAQLCTLLPITRARLPSPVSSEAFARRLSQRQRSASGDQLNLFVGALERDTIGDPLLGVWESMHRAMQLVLAALQSLPIRSHIQHPDPAATITKPTITQLPPGYHRCSACLLLSLRLALVFNENCIDELRGGEQHLALLHGTLPRLLLGLSTSVTVMQAAGHPEAEVQRVHFVRFLLYLGPLQSRILLEDIRDHCQDVATHPTDKVTTSYPDYLAHLLASSPVVTGWPGSPPAKPSSEHSYSTAGASSGLGPTSGSSSSRGWGRSKVQGSSQGQSGKGFSTGSPMDLASVNTYAHVAQALCAVLGRQEERLIITQLVSMCQAEAMGVVTRESHCLKYVWDILNAASAASRLGAVASCHQSTPSSASSSPLLSIVLSVLPRCLVALQAGVAATRLGALLGTLYTPGAFHGCFRKFYTLLCDVLQLMVELWPHWRCRPAVLRLLTRTAAAGVDGYSTMAMLLDGAPNYEAETRLLSGLKRKPKLEARTPELETILSDTLEGACTRWVLLISPQGQSEQAFSGMRIRLNNSHQQGQNAKGSAACGRKEVHNLPPSAQQLAPLALDLVWGMEGMLQMMQQHWHIIWPMVCRGDITKMFSPFQTCSVLLGLFGHVIEVLAEPAAVGPAGLAAQPASWLPCGNSLVEGWCTKLLAWVCQLFYINSPSLEGLLDQIRSIGCGTLAGSHKFLLRGRLQGPPSMSPEAERLLACLTLVLTVVAPLDARLAVTPSLPAARARVLEPASAIRGLLTRVEAEQVWSWQALAAGTPAEASLASVLQGAANKLQLPHLVAPAPQGWQPGRLTLDRGKGPPDFMNMCFPSL
ncbi:hypothetical protein QJQ45_008573 [Haematococcus lacustris]|nr:hypothetical protein QJQ45_008573 [Haematococcus lacustris]